MMRSWTLDLKLNDKEKKQVFNGWYGKIKKYFYFCIRKKLIFNY